MMESSELTKLTMSGGMSTVAQIGEQVLPETLSDAKRESLTRITEELPDNIFRFMDGWRTIKPEEAPPLEKKHKELAKVCTEIYQQASMRLFRGNDALEFLKHPETTNIKGTIDIAISTNPGRFEIYFKTINIPTKAKDYEGHLGSFLDENPYDLDNPEYGDRIKNYLAGRRNDGPYELIDLYIKARQNALMSGHNIKDDLTEHGWTDIVEISVKSIA
jgi:hypothetical protein